MSRRILTALALTAAAAASIATSQVEPGWRVSDYANEDITLSADQPEVVREVEVYASDEVMEVGDIELSLGVSLSVEVAEEGPDEVPAQVALEVFHGEVLLGEALATPALDSGFEYLYVDASGLFDLCGAEACAETLELVLTSDGDEFLAGSWSVSGGAHAPDPDGEPQPVPEGAELVVSVL